MFRTRMPMTIGHTWFKILFLAGLCAALCGPPLAAPASAQDAQGNASVELVDQTDWVFDGRPFDIAMRVQTDLPLDQAEVAVTVYGQIRNRSSFQQTLEGRNLGSTAFLERQSLSDALGPDGVVRMSLPVQDSKQRRYYLRNSGVFPVKVEIRNAGTTQALDSFITHLVNLAPDAGAVTKLNVAPVFTVASPVANAIEDPISLPDKGASVQAMSSVLASNPGLQAAIVPSPESLERLADDPDGTRALASLVQTAGNRPVYSTSWTPSDAPIYSGELSGEGKRQLERGAAVTRATVGKVDQKTFVSFGSTDEAMLRSLRDSGVERVLVPDTSLATRNQLTLLRPFQVSTGDRDQTLQAVQIDSALQSHFADPEGPVLGAHRLMADLAVLWNDLPVQERGVVLTGPAGWTADPTFMNLLARGLQDGPLVGSTTVDTVYGLPKATGGTRELASTPDDIKDRYSQSAISQQRAKVDSMASLFGGKGKTLDSLERRMLAAESSVLDHEGHKKAIDAVGDNVERTIGSIRLPSERSIRLTSRTGEIPVSVQNDSGEEINVVVRLSSDKVAFPNGASQDLKVERQQLTQRFGVDAKASGVFPVQVRLETPDGSMVIARSRILVSSTATTGVGLALTIGAGAFLVIWWARSAIRSRRDA